MQSDYEARMWDMFQKELDRTRAKIEQLEKEHGGLVTKVQIISLKISMFVSALVFGGRWLMDHLGDK